MHASNFELVSGKLPINKLDWDFAPKICEQLSFKPVKVVGQYRVQTHAHKN